MMGSGDSPLPYDAEIEYLENTSASYIDVGIVPDDKTGIKCVAFGTASDNFMLGLKDTANGNTRWAMANSGNGKYYYGYGTSGGVQTIPTNKTAVIRLNFLNNKQCNLVDIDETTPSAQALPTLGFVPQNQIRLFGSSGVSASYTTWKGKIYSVQISQDQTIVMDLIPVRVGTTGYMYDKVSGELFGNAGTGDFALGNDK